MKATKRLSMLLLVVVMLAMAVIPVLAVNYTPVNGTAGNLLAKVLIIDADAEIPNATFTFTASAGTAVEATDTTVKVWAGLNPNQVKINGTAETGTVTYTAGEAKTSDPSTGKVVTTDDPETGKISIEKPISLDFSAISYPEPGVYRYLITETTPTAPFYAADSTVTTVDVYVEDDSPKTVSTVTGYQLTSDPTTTITVEAYEALGDAEKANYEAITGTTETIALKIAGYVAYEGAVTAAPKTTATATNTVENVDWDDADVKTAADTDSNGEVSDAEKAAYVSKLNQEAVPNGAEPQDAEKDNKFRNQMDSYDLEFGKEVTGNQGSKDQYFQFSLTLGNLGNGTVVTVEVSENEIRTPHDNTATSYTASDMTAANARDDDNTKTGQQLVADASGEINWTVYLHDGQYITIQGLPTGATYALTEADAAGYTKTEGITAAVGRGGVAYQDPISGTIGQITGYVNKNDDTDTKTVEEYNSLNDEQKANYKAVHAEDVKTGFTNNREGVIPTGLLLKIGAPIAGLLLACGLLIVALVTKRRKEQEAAE